MPSRTDVLQARYQQLILILVCCLLCACVTAQQRAAKHLHHGSHKPHHHQHRHNSSSHAADQQPGHAYVAVCAVMRNEQLNVGEWVQYHAWLGVEKFYIFDHGSKPPLAVTLQQHVEKGLVELFYFQNSWQVDAHQFAQMYKTPSRQFLSPQGWAYDNCYRCGLACMQAHMCMAARGMHGLISALGDACAITQVPARAQEQHSCAAAVSHRGPRSGTSPLRPRAATRACI